MNHLFFGGGCWGSLCCFAASAANFLSTDQVPSPGRWSVRSHLQYTPYFLTLLQDVPKAKDCPESPSKEEEDSCFPAVKRPLESRHYAQLVTRANFGLAPEYGLEFGLPLAYVQQFSQNPTQLPPGMSSVVQFGTGDLSVALRRRILTAATYGLIGTVRANLPPMGHPLGTELYPCVLSGPAGKPTIKEFVVFPSAPSTDVGFYGFQEIWGDRAAFAGKLGANIPFRRVGIEPAVTWRGMRYDYAGSFEFRPLRPLGLQVEAIGEWANPAEQVEEGRLDHLQVCNTGHTRLELAPGVSWRVDGTTAIWAALSIPILYRGFQRDFPFMTGSLGLHVNL